MADDKANKPWWQSKTIWGIGLYALSKIMAAIPVSAPFAPAVEVIAAGLAGIGIRTAQGQLTK